MRLATRSDLGRQFAYASFWRLLKSTSGADGIKKPSAFLATCLKLDNKILDDIEYAERNRAQLAVRGSQDIGRIEGRRWSDREW